MHGTHEGRLRPGADAGFRVGRDVGRVDHAERGCERVAAGEVLPTLGRVTLRAIAAARKAFALGDQFRREAFWSRPRDRSNGRPPRQHAKAREPETSESNDRDEQLLEHGVLRLPAWLASSFSYGTGAQSRESRLAKNAKSVESDSRDHGVRRNFR